MSTLLATGDKYGIDRNRIVVGGDSSGGNLAAAVALKLRDEGKRLAAQVREPLTCSLLHCGTYANSPGLYSGVSRTQNKSPSLPYSLPNISQTKLNLKIIIFSIRDEKSSLFSKLLIIIYIGF